MSKKRAVAISTGKNIAAWFGQILPAMKLALKKILTNLQVDSPGRRRLWKMVTAGIWIIFLAYIFYSGWQNHQLWLPYVASADLRRISGIFFYYMLSLISSIIGWVVIMKSFAPAVGSWQHTQIYCLTLAARRLPGTAWYIGGRMALYPRLGVARRTVLFASSLEMIVTVVSGGLTALVLALVSEAEISTFALVLLALCTAIGLLLLHPAVLHAILKPVDPNLAQKLRVSRLPLWLLAYVAMWCTSGLMVSQMVNVLQPVSAADTMRIVAVWSIAGAIGLLTFFLPSSFGATELTLTALLTPIMPLALAGAVAIAVRLFTLVMETLLAAVFQLLYTRFPLSYVQAPPASSENSPASGDLADIPDASAESKGTYGSM